MKNPFTRARRKRSLRRRRRSYRRANQFNASLTSFEQALFTLASTGVSTTSMTEAMAKLVEQYVKIVEAQKLALQAQALQPQYYKVTVTARPPNLKGVSTHQQYTVPAPTSVSVGPVGFSEHERTLTRPSDTPDVMGYVEGLRIFKASYRLSGVVMLHSMIKEEAWLRGTNTARCLARMEHSAPDPRCHCGFWAVHKLTHLPDIPSHRPGIYVLGKARGWGSVVEGEYGWRAEYARVDCLYDMKFYDVPPPRTDLLEIIATHYGVPIKSFDDLRREEWSEG